MVRSEVNELTRIGAFPASGGANLDDVRRRELLLRDIHPPISDDEARELMKVFGPDDYYGLAWTVLHLIERAPGWPLRDCLANNSNEWVARLRKRAEARENQTRGRTADL